MDRFNQYRVFVQVAEMGSFIRAAHALEVPRASVSAAVQQLETQLGVRLLHRTTRQVRLTADGEQLLERLRPLLAEVEDIDQSFQASQRQASGRLSIDVPSRIARRLIAPALPGLLRRHPHLQLVLGSADRAIDLVQEGVDCAVRVGDLHDSSLVMRPLGHIALINCASPLTWANSATRASPAISSRDTGASATPRPKPAANPLGIPGRRRPYATARTAQPGGGQQRRKLYRLLPRRAGADADPALRRATPARRR